MTSFERRSVALAAALALGASLASVPAFAQADDVGVRVHHRERLVLRAHREPVRAGYRSLTVRRRVVEPVVVAAPVVAPGPAAVVTAPIAAASALVALPFQIANGIFPPDAPPPANLIGAPIAAAGQIAQVPFRILEAPFGVPTI